MVVKVLVGDCIAKLRELPADSVHCVVTSPPYWGLRDYGTGTWEGGEAGCEHGVERWEGPKQTQGAQSGHASKADRLNRGECRCGARRIDQQIGLEPTPEAWAARLVEVFREVRRVLRPDGVCFVNVGDSYCSTPNGRSAADVKALGNDDRTFRDKPVGVPAGYKPKDLIGQPWLLAFALRADGWWLRSEIIWAKPNPMPESVDGWRWEPHRVRDPETGKLVECPGCPKCEPNDGLVLSKGSWRPTKAHEYVFMLAKSDCYFGDAEAVREAAEGVVSRPSFRGGCYVSGEPGKSLDVGNVYRPAGRNLRSVWTIATEPFNGSDLLADYVGSDGKPYTASIDHFATYPTELPRKCILAGTSAKGCCPACGAPWARVVERTALNGSPVITDDRKDLHGPTYSRHRQSIPGGQSLVGYAAHSTGWRPTCACGAGDPVPCTVLDPFGGSGTTGLVAEQLGRDAILIELSPAYAEMAERRLAKARAKRYLGADAKHIAPLPGQLDLLGDGA